LIVAAKNAHAHDRKCVRDGHKQARKMKREAGDVRQRVQHLAHALRDAEKAQEPQRRAHLKGISGAQRQPLPDTAKACSDAHHVLRGRGSIDSAADGIKAVDSDATTKRERVFGEGFRKKGGNP